MVSSQSLADNYRLCAPPNLALWTLKSFFCITRDAAFVFSMLVSFDKQFHLLPCTFTSWPGRNTWTPVEVLHFWLLVLKPRERILGQLHPAHDSCVQWNPLFTHGLFFLLHPCLAFLWPAAVTQFCVYFWVRFLLSWDSLFCVYIRSLIRQSEAFKLSISS